MVEPLWKAVWQLLRKFNIYLSYDLAVPVLGIEVKLIENLCLHKDSYVNIHSNVIHTGPRLEAIQITVNWKMDKQQLVYLYKRVLWNSIKKWTADTWIKLDILKNVLSERIWHKRLYSLWFNFYEISRKGKTIKMKSKSVVAWYRSGD